jgi:hypothetical protein
MDARNDSNYSGLGGVPLALAKALNNGLYRWLWDRSGSDNTFQRIIWDNNVVPVDPTTAGIPMATHFRGRGLCVWRTGWEKDDVMLSFEAGPYMPITHNQADKGHFNLYGLGYRWAVDTGYSNEREKNGRGQAAAHSCVLIDDKGQALSGAGLGTDGEIVTYKNTKRYGYALADCTKAYQKNNRDMPGVGVEFAKRHIFFVYPKGKAPAYTVVLDDIRKDDETHDFTWQFLTSRDLVGTVDDTTAIFAPNDASGNAYVDTPWTSSDDAVASVAAGAVPPGELHFELSVKKAGSYTVWGRVRTQAEERAKADSFMVQMDKDQRLAWHMPTTGSWTWAKVTSGVTKDPVTFELSAGKHRLIIARREPAAQIDCLFLTEDAETPPTPEAVRNDPLFREAEDGQLTAPMRTVRLPGNPTRLMVRVDGIDPITMRTDTRETLDYHGPNSYPILRADSKSVNPRFMAVLLPLPADTRDPKVVFRKTDSARMVGIRWSDHDDVLTWPNDPEKLPSLK